MYYSVSRLMYKFSWKQLETAKTYIHENSKRMKKATLVEEGIEESQKDDAFSRQICAECGESWCPTTKYCGKCSGNLSEQEDVEEAANQELVERIKQLEAQMG